jgi:hypothetical protein
MHLAFQAEYEGSIPFTRSSLNQSTTALSFQTSSTIPPAFAAFLHSDPWKLNDGRAAQIKI